MRHNRTVVGFGHHRNFAQLIHATGIDGIRLDVVTGVFLEHFSELMTRDVTFACGDGGTCAALQLDVSIEVFRGQGLLHEKQIELLKALRQTSGLRQIEAAMGVDHQAYIRADRFSNLTHTLDGDVLLLDRHRMGCIAKRAPLECAKSVLDRTRSTFGILTNTGFAQLCLHEPIVSVTRYGFTNRPPKQLIARHAERLALDVPAGNLDSTQSNVNEQVRAKELPTVAVLPEMLDGARVFANHRSLIVFDECRDGTFEGLECPFTDADNAFVRLYFDEHPVTTMCLNQVGLDVGYLHRPRPLIVGYRLITSLLHGTPPSTPTAADAVRHLIDDSQIGYPGEGKIIVTVWTFRWKTSKCRAQPDRGTAPLNATPAVLSIRESARQTGRAGITRRQNCVASKLKRFH